MEIQSYEDDLSQISLTGLRALVLLGLLIKAPRSLEEIRETFIKYNIMGDDNSYDILRIDLNTLRAMGCEISRADSSTNFKYALLKHPFYLKLSDDDISSLKRAYKKVKENASVELLIKLNNLLKKLANHVEDDIKKEKLLGISILKKFNVELIQELLDDCKNKRVLNLYYKNPVSKTKEEKNVLAQKIVYNNDKVYLYGIDLNSKQSITLNIKRIASIFSRGKDSGGVDVKPVTIKFKLKDFNYLGLNENENILSIEEGSYLIEGKYHNEFWALQRILSFGPLCTVVEPKDFKDKVVKMLKEMRDIYND